MHEAAAVDDYLARRAVHGLLEALHPLLAHLERQCAKTTRPRVELGDPGAAGPEHAGEVLHQRPEEALADLARRPLEDEAERSLRRRVWQLAGG